MPEKQTGENTANKASEMHSRRRHECAHQIQMIQVSFVSGFRMRRESFEY